MNRRWPWRIATPKLRARIPGGRRSEIGSRHSDVRRIGRHEGGKRSRLKDKHRSYLEHSNPGKRRRDPARVSRIAGDVVGHRRGEPERPGKRKDARDDDQQREIAAVLGAETSRDEDAADDDDQLEAAGGGKRSDNGAAGARPQARPERLRDRQPISPASRSHGPWRGRRRTLRSLYSKPSPQQTALSATARGLRCARVFAATAH